MTGLVAAAAGSRAEMLLAGLGLALLSAFATNIGFLFRHRGAVAAPDVDAHHPLRSAVALFRSTWWTIGYGVAALAYALHVGALALAPLSLVQAVLAGGLVVLGVVAERWFGFTLGKREWVESTEAGGAGMHGVGSRRSLHYARTRGRIQNAGFRRR